MEYPNISRVPTNSISTKILVCQHVPKKSAVWHA